MRLLFKGERKAKKCYECEDCGRSIYKGERYHARVTLEIHDAREVTLQRRCICCKPF